MQNVTEFVRGLDIRTPQLSIQAKIIFVDRTDVEELGIKYDLGDKNQFFNRLVRRTDPTTGSPFDRQRQRHQPRWEQRRRVERGRHHHRLALDLIYSTSRVDWLTTFLSALETSQLADIQAEPVITTLDNRQADILVGQETPVRVIDASGLLQRRPRERAVQGDRYPAHRHAA